MTKQKLERQRSQAHDQRWLVPRPMPQAGTGIRQRQLERVASEQALQGIRQGSGRGVAAFGPKCSGGATLKARQAGEKCCQDCQESQIESSAGGPGVN